MQYIKHKYNVYSPIRYKEYIIDWRIGLLIISITVLASLDFWNY